LQAFATYDVFDPFTGSGGILINGHMVDCGRLEVWDIDRMLRDRMGEWLSIAALVCLILGATTTLAIVAAIQIKPSMPGYLTSRDSWGMSFWASWLLSFALVAFGVRWILRRNTGTVPPSPVSIRDLVARIYTLEQRLAAMEEAVANRSEAQNEIVDSLNSAVEAVNDLSRRVRDLEQDLDNT